MGVQKEYSFRVPKQFDAPWLTEGYVREHAWEPIASPLIDEPPRGVWRINPIWGKLQSKPRFEFSPGDVIIYDLYDETVLSNKDVISSRFRTVTEQDIQNYLDKKIDLLPFGVVVHPPWYYGYQDARVPQKII